MRNIASDLFLQQYSVGLKVGLARFSGQVGARGNASDGLIHSFNRILIKGVDEHQNMCFRLDLPSKNVGLRIGLARFSLQYFVQHIVFA